MQTLIKPSAKITLCKNTTVDSGTECETASIAIIIANDDIIING